MEKKKCSESVPTMVKKVKPNLAGDIIESNILTRVPIKTLIRFTAVCKSWYSLLSNPYFTNSYNQIQKSRTNNLLLVDYLYENCVAVADSCSWEKKSSSSFKYTTSQNSPHKLVKVVGCFDGIVCMFDHSSLHKKYRISLWNPALRITKIVDSYDHTSSLCVGFGYDTRTKDHNVVKFYNDVSRLIDHVEIYSLNSDSWRKIELDSNQVIKERYAVEQFGVYVSSRINGAYCWLARKWDQITRDVVGDETIIALHMEDETFKEMSTLPHPYGNTLFIYKDSLGVCNTQSTLCRDNSYSKTCYIWVMKEYGDPKSWTMLCKFDSQRPYVSFVGVVEETEVMLLCCTGHDGWMNAINEKVITIDTGTLEQDMTIYIKDMGFLTKAIWFSSFTESLALLKGVRSLNSCNN